MRRSKQKYPKPEVIGTPEAMKDHAELSSWMRLSISPQPAVNCTEVPFNALVQALE